MPRAKRWARMASPTFARRCSLSDLPDTLATLAKVAMDGIFNHGIYAPF
jgi:hypothetical protein